MFNNEVLSFCIGRGVFTNIIRSWSIVYWVLISFILFSFLLYKCTKLLYWILFHLTKSLYFFWFWFLRFPNYILNLTNFVWNFNRKWIFLRFWRVRWIIKVIIWKLTISSYLLWSPWINFLRYRVKTLFKIRFYSLKLF